MAEPCGAEHPEMPGVLCTKPMPCYIFHRDSRADEFWRGEPEPEQGESRRKEVDKMAKKISPPRKTGPPSPFVRTEDPDTAHEAIRRYEPKRETCKARVLAHLRAHLGEWIDASEFMRSDIGNDEGKRRLRELREEGWPIETRPKPGTKNTWQHRLLYGMPVMTEQSEPESADVLMDWD